MTTLAPQFQRSLRDQLVDDIGRQIVKGELQPGDLLPNESELLAHYNVSRTVLREALHVLSAKGLIDSRQRRGTTVRPRLEWNQLDRTLLEWHGILDTSDDSLWQLMEVRQIVEPPAAMLAAQHAKPQDRARIEAAYIGMETAGENVDAFIGADLEFHTSILEACGNQFLLPIVHAIRTTLVGSMRITNPDPDENHRVSLPLHEAILKAILAGDGEQAAQAMRVHLDDTANRMRRRQAQNAGASKREIAV